MERFHLANPELKTDWILRDAGLTKRGCLRILQEAGIALPAMYALGFKNNNCIGCVKASSPKYWNAVRRYFPSVFESRARLSRDLGARLARHNGERIFLDELPRDEMLEFEEDLSCGPECR